MTGLLQHQEQLCAVVDYVHGQDLGGSLNCLVECFEVGRRLLVDADDNIALSEAAPRRQPCWSLAIGEQCTSTSMMKASAPYSTNAH